MGMVGKGFYCRQEGATGSQMTGEEIKQSRQQNEY